VSRDRGLWVLLAVTAGVAAGWTLSRRYLERHKAALFSPRLRRRHAALGYLAGHPAAETVTLLRDYLAWEKHPALRRRAARVARELEMALE
jgi:membrane-associated PAP2 superfamily phosphatase